MVFLPCSSIRCRQECCRVHWKHIPPLAHFGNKKFVPLLNSLILVVLAPWVPVVDHAWEVVLRLHSLLQVPAHIELLHVTQGMLSAVVAIVLCSFCPFHISDARSWVHCFLQQPVAGLLLLAVLWHARHDELLLSISIRDLYVQK